LAALVHNVYNRSWPSNKQASGIWAGQYHRLRSIDFVFELSP
jgi:hypothetical protein